MPRDPLSDQELAARANRGDPDAFEELYRRERAWILGVATRYLHDRDDDGKFAPKGGGGSERTGGSVVEDTNKPSPEGDAAADCFQP